MQSLYKKWSKLSEEERITFTADAFICGIIIPFFFRLGGHGFWTAVGIGFTVFYVVRLQHYYGR